MMEVWTDMQTYIEEMTAAFITGARPLSEWDAYVAEFNRMSLDRYMEVYQTMYDRYTAQ